MKSNEPLKFINEQRYAREHKRENLHAILKELDKIAQNGEYGIRKSDKKPIYSISDSQLKQAHIERILKEPMIKIFLNHKGYSDMTDSDKDNWIYFDNGKTSIEILAEHRDSFPCKYEFNEHFENEEIVSKGCFPIKSSGISPYEFDDDRCSYFYFLEPNYNGSEYFRQAFLYDNKLATISLIVKKVAEHPGWCCTYPEFSVFIVVGYYDLDNNVSLKGYKTDFMFEDISLVGSILSSKATPDFTDTIFVVPSACDNYANWDSSFFIKRIKGFQEPIQKGLSKAYRKVERYFGTKLELKENFRLVKKLLPIKNKGGK